LGPASQLYDLPELLESFPWFFGLALEKITLAGMRFKSPVKQQSPDR